MTYINKHDRLLTSLMRLPYTHGVRLIDLTGMLSTIVVGTAYAFCIILPVYVLQALDSIRASTSTLILSCTYYDFILFGFLGVCVVKGSLHLAAHIELRSRAMMSEKLGTLGYVVPALLGLILYKVLVDRITSSIGNVHDDDAVGNFQSFMSGWVIGWFLVLGYICKSPWDRARAIIISPSLEHDAIPRLGIGWRLFVLCLAYDASMVILIVQPHVDVDVNRASRARYLEHRCPSAWPMILPYLSDHRITEDEREVIRTILSNERARPGGLDRCKARPAAFT